MTIAAGILGGRYRLGETLGRGGIGVVWRAHDELLQREVAVKEVRFPPGLTEEERRALVDRTLDEARQVAAIDIAAAVRVFDIVEQDDRPWIVMELVEGETLTDVLGRERQLPSSEVARIGLCLLDALEAAHRAGVVHRDVKPSNVIVGSDGRIALTDFGIATVDDEDDSTGVTIGAPGYLAPERALGEPATPSSDLWALGATLWTTAEGRPPYAGATSQDVLDAITSGDPPRCTSCTGPLSELLNGLMARDPADRPDTATIRDMLEEVARESRISEGMCWPLDSTDEPLPSTFDRTTRLPTTSGSGAAEPADGDGRTWPLVAALLAVLIGTSIVLTLLLRGGSGDPSGPARDTQSADVGLDAPAELPSGRHRYTDPAGGWSVGLPSGWTPTVANGTVRFDDPAGGRYLMVDPRLGVVPSVVDTWKSQETAFAAAHLDYDRIGVRSVEVAGAKDAADWEFTYVDQGAALHALDRGVMVGGHTYALFFQTHTDQWDSSQSLRRQLFATFRP
jgi:serine/threonine protein kinase